MFVVREENQSWKKEGGEKHEIAGANRRQPGKKNNPDIPRHSLLAGPNTARKISSNMSQIHVILNANDRFHHVSDIIPRPGRCVPEMQTLRL